MENRLDSIAMIYLILSIFAAGILIFVAIEEINQPTGMAAVYFSIGVGALFQGVIFWSLLESFAEIIRLLKKSNNIPYYGNISGNDDNENDYSDGHSEVDSVIKVECEICGAKINKGTTFCSECGAKIS